MTEADEVAESIVKSAGRRARSWNEAVALVTRFMGPPSEVGYQLHDNIAEALLDN